MHSSIGIEILSYRHSMFDVRCRSTGTAVHNGSDGNAGVDSAVFA